MTIDSLRAKIFQISNSRSCGKMNLMTEKAMVEESKDNFNGNIKQARATVLTTIIRCNEDPTNNNTAKSSELSNKPCS